MAKDCEDEELAETPPADRCRTTISELSDAAPLEAGSDPPLERRSVASLGAACEAALRAAGRGVGVRTVGLTFGTLVAGWLVVRSSDSRCLPRSRGPGGADCALRSFDRGTGGTEAAGPESGRRSLGSWQPRLWELLLRARSSRRRLRASYAAAKCRHCCRSRYLWQVQLPCGARASSTVFGIRTR